MHKLGIAVIGVGGAVGTTIAAGLELLRADAIDKRGLPLAEIDSAGLVPYTDIAVAGWDVFSHDLAAAAAEHDVLTHKQFTAVEAALREITPWPAVYDANFISGLEGSNRIDADSHRQAIELITANLDELKSRCESVVMINLASTERLPVEGNAVFGSLRNLEQGIDDDLVEISPAILYAYAAIKAGVPYGNFTPSTSADLPAMIELAEKEGVPVAGKDGKTGQTFIKSVLAPALRDRALHVDGWFSTNILGNRDGFVLNDEGSLASKVKTKSSLLDDIMGYEVEDHIVDIRYYRPRKDNKEAWDNVDISGFLGQPMQIKVNFLCRDSILAAPLAIEIARCLDLADRRGESGVQDQLAAFFKLPMTSASSPEHSFFLQQKALMDWLAS